MDICVFNIKTMGVSYKRLKPSKNWGGQGVLGLELGVGAMHSLGKILELTEDAKKEKSENIME